MKILIAMKHVRLLKKELGRQLPAVKSSHRVEAMARGLGWKSNAALRACLLCGPTECLVEDERFAAYLVERGGGDVPQTCLSSAVLQMIVDQHNVSAVLSESGGAGADTPRPLFASGLLRDRWPAGLAGTTICLAAFIAASQPVFHGFMDANVEQMMASSEEQASRAVFTLNGDMAQQAVELLMQAPFVTSVRVKDDRDDLLAGSMIERVYGEWEPFSIAAMLEPDGEKTYRRKLKMPDGLDGPGVLEVTVDRKQAIAASGGHTTLGLLLVALLGWVLGSHSGRIGPSRLGKAVMSRAQASLIRHFSYQAASGVTS